MICAPKFGHMSFLNFEAKHFLIKVWRKCCLATFRSMLKYPQAFCTLKTIQKRMDGMIQKIYVFDKANYISLICKFEGQHAVPSNLN